MTRNWSAAALAQADTGRYTPVILVDAEFEDSAGNAATLSLFTGIGTLTIGGTTYTGAGDLLRIEGIEEINRLAARGVTVSLNGIGVSEVNGAGDSILDLAYRTEYQNRPCTVSLALLDPDTQQPIGDPEPWFVGTMDVMTPEEDGENATITMTVENAQIALERPVGRTYTAEDQKERYSGDTFFDHVSTLQNLEIDLD
ncbi:MAG: hypothetical protein R8L07_03385 [Alphaproteobacteria bacterium]|nr:hypothetical protein [Alphaproteobacteria bacterium]